MAASSGEYVWFAIQYRTAGNSANILSRTSWKEPPIVFSARRYSPAHFQVWSNIFLWSFRTYSSQAIFSALMRSPMAHFLAKSMFSRSHSFSSSLVARFGIRSASSSAERGVLPSLVNCIVVTLFPFAQDASRFFFDLFRHPSNRLVFQRHTVFNGADVCSNFGSRRLFRKFANASSLWHEGIDKLTSQGICRVAKTPQSDPVLSLRFLQIAHERRALVEMLRQLPQGNSSRFANRTNPTPLRTCRVPGRDKWL